MVTPFSMLIRAANCGFAADQVVIPRMVMECRRRSVGPWRAVGDMGGVTERS
ncbi:hypothetical protein AB0I84_04095 [Streptomyces spectabilis]|uniref:Uncharacterized protein n=1 Tax=Streptomyces spectabilis TaxID=68270 RepID=A0A7W8AZV4_STRST|nr:MULTISPECIES: hypothetical protein [Streptomyces]MBB5106387.1 hypothetical protein [Streptomyces spectabilis]MCI3902996.1 hypothetical protein [Streptomyces spectabilis]